MFKKLKKFDHAKIIFFIKKIHFCE